MLQSAHRNVVLLLLTLFVCLAVSSPIQAQTTMYTDPSTFMAATSNLSTIDFAAANTNGAGSYTTYNDANGLTLQGVNFVGSVSNGSYRLAAIDPGFFSTYSGWNGNPTVLSDGSNDTAGLSRTLTITLPSGITAVGTKVYTAAIGDGSSNTVGNVTFQLSTGNTFTINTFSKPNLAFAGFTSSSDIASLTITTSSDLYPNLSNFVFGQAVAPVPAPSALLTALMGSVPGLGFVYRRLRRRR